jgi:hypothetical protein
MCLEVLRLRDSKALSVVSLRALVSCVCLEVLCLGDFRSASSGSCGRQLPRGCAVGWRVLGSFAVSDIGNGANSG